MDHRHFLSHLFEPAAAALIVGARVPAWATGLIDQLAADHPVTELWRVIAGEPAHELAMIALDPHEVPAGIALAARLRARVVSVMTEQADAGQARLWREQAHALGMRLLGPGTMGFVRPAMQLNAGRMGPLPAAGR